ncbi:hypothetical protein CC80DRAFT_571362 [Byssothecium circinans]|uniref:Uncharacterized protein n=1 Tax=Byssothecium circinans TaxID=147558 RepID=A0A6A5TL62_9PLEO|nr:hypothetical protein CC80DRAFT_571362 [Byssothecium circinans]
MHDQGAILLDFFLSTPVLTRSNTAAEHPQLILQFSNVSLLNSNKLTTMTSRDNFKLTEDVTHDDLLVLCNMIFDSSASDALWSAAVRDVSRQDLTTSWPRFMKCVLESPAVASMQNILRSPASMSVSHITSLLSAQLSTIAKTLRRFVVRPIFSSLARGWTG